MSVLDKKGAELLADIRANQHRIDACEKHHFVWPEFGLSFGQKLHCTNCDGKMDAIQAFAYTKGFAAAGGDPNEIIENFC